MIKCILDWLLLPSLVGINHLGVFAALKSYQSSRQSFLSIYSLVWTVAETKGEKTAAEQKNLSNGAKLIHLEWNTISFLRSEKGAASSVNYIHFYLSDDRFQIDENDRPRVHAIENSSSSSNFHFSYLNGLISALHPLYAVLLVNALPRLPWIECMCRPLCRDKDSDIEFFTFSLTFSFFSLCFRMQTTQSSQWTSSDGLEQLPATANWRGWLHFHLVASDDFTAAAALVWILECLNFNIQL